MMTHRPESIDDINWNILTALQTDARLSFRDLGRRVGLTAPAVAERVRRLEEAGVITAYRAVLNPDQLGRPIMAIIRVSAPEEHCQRSTAQGTSATLSSDPCPADPEPEWRSDRERLSECYWLTAI
jgi:Lrp/AsnC family leucine-responsive transcriptional regulator